MRELLPILILLVPSLAAQADKAAIARSNALTQKLIDIEIRYSPENASQEGLAKFDTKISDPSLEAVRAQRKEEEAAVGKLVAARAAEKDPLVAEDLDILIASERHDFRQQDFDLQHTVQYINATTFIYSGIAALLDDQVPSGRRISANERLKRYAGINPDPAANRGTEMANMGRNAAANTGLTDTGSSAYRGFQLLPSLLSHTAPVSVVSWNAGGLAAAFFLS